MTVKELAAHLSIYPDDAVVLISSDSEGNALNNIWQVGKEYGVDDDWGGMDIISEEDLNEFEGDVREVIVIWP